jgi:hypothetical protein
MIDGYGKENSFCIQKKGTQRRKIYLGEELTLVQEAYCTVTCLKYWLHEKRENGLIIEVVVS